MTKKNAFSLILVILVIVGGIFWWNWMHVPNQERTSEQRKQYIRSTYGIDVTPIERLANPELSRKQVDKLVKKIALEQLNSKQPNSRTNDPEWQILYLRYLENLYKHKNKYSPEERLTTFHSKIGTVWSWSISSQSFRNQYRMKTILEKLSNNKSISEEELSNFHQFIKENFKFPNESFRKKISSVLNEHSASILSDLETVNGETTLRLKIFKSLGLISIAEVDLVSCEIRKQILDSSVSNYTQEDLGQIKFGPVFLEVFEKELSFIKENC